MNCAKECANAEISHNVRAQQTENVEKMNHMNLFDCFNRNDDHRKHLVKRQNTRAQVYETNMKLISFKTISSLITISCRGIIT